VFSAELRGGALLRKGISAHHEFHRIMGYDAFAMTRDSKWFVFIPYFRS
jgi:hypothetical protein